MAEAILPWQVEQWQQLQAVRESGRLPHALLLSGPQGIGKQRFSQALMESLACEQPTAEGACGNCRSCHFGAENPDLHTVVPAEGKKQIGVDQIRELVEILSKTAHRTGGRKVIQIVPADAMNTHTANALLKTLEEPSGDTVLILLCDAPARLLPTIRSRCHQIVFPVPPREQALNWLRLSVGDAAQACLDEVSGRPLAAKELYETDGLSSRQRCDEQLRRYSDGMQNLGQTVDVLLEQELEFCLEWLVQRFHALAKASMTGNLELLPEMWQAWVSKPPAAVLRVQEQVLELRAQQQRGVALNKRLTLESLLLSWCQ